MYIYVHCDIKKTDMLILHKYRHNTEEGEGVESEGELVYFVEKWCLTYIKHLNLHSLHFKTTTQNSLSDVGTTIVQWVYLQHIVIVIQECYLCKGHDGAKWRLNVNKCHL